MTPNVKSISLHFYVPVIWTIMYLILVKAVVTYVWIKNSSKRWVVSCKLCYLNKINQMIIVQKRICMLVYCIVLEACYLCEFWLNPMQIYTMQDHSKLPLNKPSDAVRINRRMDKTLILILSVSASSTVTSQQNMPRVMRT